MMKKYSDWQKYVKEQIDRMGVQPADNEKKSPQRQVPSFDTDKFAIRRNDAPPRTQGLTPAAPSYPDRAAQRPPVQPKTPVQQTLTTESPKDVSQSTPAAAGPMASPFVSVGDVWKAAEKRQAPETRQPAVQPRPKPAAADARPAVKVEQAAPVPKQARDHEKPRAVISADSPALNGESREELIERLMNPVITLDQAALIMGVCKATVRRYTSRGRRPHYRPAGNQRRFTLNDVIRFIEGRNEAGAAAPDVAD